MLPGPWLLLRALLILGATPGAPAHQGWTSSVSTMGPSSSPAREAPSQPVANSTGKPPGNEYTPGTQYPPAPGTQYPSAPGTQYLPAPGTQYPPAPGTQYLPAAGTQYPPAPGTQYPPAPGTQYPPAPGTQYPPAPGTQYPPAPGTQYPPAPGTQYLPGPSTYLPADPGAHIPPEPGGWDAPNSSEAGVTGTHIPPQTLSVTHMNSQPGGPGRRTASEPWRSGFWTEEEALDGTHIPPEPMRTTFSEPARTGALLITAPGANETPSVPEESTTGNHRAREPRRDWVQLLSEPSQTAINKPVWARTDQSSEPIRTGTNPSSEPVRTDTNPLSEPVRTGTNPSSEPVRTNTDPLSEPVRTGTETSSEPSSVVIRTRAEDYTVTQTESHISTGSEPGGTEKDPLPAAGQTGSATDVVPWSVMRRHMSKRMSHTDSYRSSTFTRGGDRTLLSVTNASVPSDITEIPSAYNIVAESTPPGAHGPPGATAEDLTNRTELGSGSTLKVSSPWGSGSDSDPLLTPSYGNSTHSSPVPHHVPDSTAPFTSVPVTAPDRTDASNSSLDFSSSSPHSSSRLSAPVSESSSSSWPFSVSSAESSPGEAATFPSSLPTGSPTSEVSSSSPIPSTLVFSDQPPAAASPPPSDVSPVSTSTGAYGPQTATSAEPGVLPVSPITALPSSSPPAAETTFTSVSSTASDSSVTGLILHSLQPHIPVTETSSFGQTDSGETSAAVTVTVPVGTSRAEDRPPGTVPPTEETWTPSATATLSTDPAPPATTFNYNTKQTHKPQNTTWPGGSKRATSGPSVETTDRQTTSVTPHTLTTTRSHKQTTLPAGMVTTTSSATSIAKPPTPSTTSRAVTASLCSSNPCQNGGRCVENTSNKMLRCECPPAWHGTYCSRDVDECLSGPCPPKATCTNTRGSFSCRCPLGYILERGAGCILVRTFLGHVTAPRRFLNSSSGKYTELHQIEEEVVGMLTSCFSGLEGFYRSIVTNSSQTNQIVVSVQNVFSLASNVTAYDLTYSLQRYIRSCESHPESSPGCHLILHPQLYYTAGSLCAVNSPGCDKDTAECSDVTGVSVCQCKPGYFKFTTMDHSCRACEDGYKRENQTCVRCPFGLGGFNCSNPYQLITVIIASAGGGILLILGIALAVMCCRKNKNDISKLIFKSGDFQMSPYAEYAKTPRSSDWGRETIEMQENGSTKNLLQMTDVYYSPGLRNPELERNGIYPYTGMPGSRHSCIYPGQFNPSFITEENRRRDYF